MDNIKQTNVEEVMRKFDRNTKIQICQQQIRLQQVDIERHEKPSVYCNRMRKALESKEEFRDLVTSLRVTLGAQNFTWIDEVIN
jgi:thioredoxin-related protein